MEKIENTETEIPSRPYCEYHSEMVRLQKEQDMAIEAKVAKGSIKWIASIFAVPAILAILVVYAFIQSSEFRFGSNVQAVTNAKNIEILNERQAALRQEVTRIQSDLNNHLEMIKSDIRDLSREIRMWHMRDFEYKNGDGKKKQP